MWLYRSGVGGFESRPVSESVSSAVGRTMVDGRQPERQAREGGSRKMMMPACLPARLAATPPTHMGAPTRTRPRGRSPWPRAWEARSGPGTFYAGCPAAIQGPCGRVPSPRRAAGGKRGYGSGWSPAAVITITSKAVEIVLATPVTDAAGVHAPARPRQERGGVDRGRRLPSSTRQGGKGSSSRRSRSRSTSLEGRI